MIVQEQDVLGDAEERCTQLMHQKVQLEETAQVKIYLIMFCARENVNNNKLYLL